MNICKLSIGYLIIFCSLTALAQTNITEEELKTFESYVVETNTIDELRSAQTRGEMVFKYKDRYFVKIGDNYESVRDLKTALRLRKANNLYVPEGPASKEDKESGLGTSYNPQLMMFPFTSTTEEGALQLELPGEQNIPANQVMIHPGPFVYDEVSFAPIDLFKSLQKFSASGNPNAPSPSLMPRELRDVKHFAVTGNISPQANVVLDNNNLDYWVGGAVVDTKGDILWKEYSQVDQDMGFKLVKKIDNTNIKPQFLLMFILAQGQLSEMLRSSPSIQPMDASQYEYHVLGSIALELGENWFPPVNEATKEEYQKMMNELKANQATLQKSQN